MALQIQVAERLETKTGLQSDLEMGSISNPEPPVDAIVNLDQTLAHATPCPAPKP